ncbi:MAG: putative metal-binding motif-containing protein [Deltaproteobacteria bacterium]|nr:putative metal-binding motif-containing protein [Deltaproteobacteria bacterium]
MLRRAPLALALLACACNSDLSVVEKAVCDGAQQTAEGRVDAPFDLDGDGFYDANNLDCQASYAAARLDCDDQDPAVHPGAAEVGCNGIDDDCDPATIDDEDRDEDGAPSCEDCDDLDAAIFPGGDEVCGDGIDNDCDAETADGEDLDDDGVLSCDDCNDLDSSTRPGVTEVCDDGKDNNCDGFIDEDCDIDRSGIYTISGVTAYSCAFGYVNVNPRTLAVTDAYPTLTVSSGSAQPGTMTGAYASATNFEVVNNIPGACTEEYRLIAAFDSDDSFVGTLTATFTGGSWCYDCANQSWAVTGVK